jgi:hypothetical protein
MDQFDRFGGSASIGNLEMIEFLASKGASNWNDAFSDSIYSRNLEVIEYFLGKGVDHFNLVNDEQNFYLLG